MERVDRGNGCLSVIPGSHKVCTTMRISAVLLILSDELHVVMGHR